MLILINCLGMVNILPVTAQDSNTITAWDLIALVNQIRSANGLPALEVNSTIMGTAQQTAEIMAANHMYNHIGDVRGRIRAAGYGGGAVVWATENFAVGPLTLDQIAVVWSDFDHMRPMTNPSYQHIGAGVAEVDGVVYYIVQAAYTGSGVNPTRTPANGTPNPTTDGTEAVSQLIMPVRTATPHSDGSIVHVVQYGQSLWSIAIAYNTHIVDIQRVNNLSQDTNTVYAGQQLIMPVTAIPTETAIPVTVTPTPAAEAFVENTLQPTQNNMTAPKSGATSQPTIQNSPTPFPTQITKNSESTNQNLVLTGVGIAGLVGLGLIVFGLFLNRKPKS